MKKQLLDTDLLARYLLDERDKKSKDMIDKIIHDDENSRREFEEYLTVWEQSARAGDFEKVDPETDWLKVRSRLRLKNYRKRIPLRSYLVRIAAVLVLAAGLSYFLIEVTKTTSRADTNYYEIASVDDTKDLVLSDGSIIYLNKHSKIIRNSNFGKDNRDIILEGEAFFEVARNKDLPFKVHSLNSTIEVVGTSFNVHTDSMEVVVSVLTGRVAFYASENTTNRVELDRDHTGVFEIQSELITPKKSIDYNMLAWHTGEFDFRNMPLSEVCHILASYYNLEFIPAKNIQFIDSINGDFSTHSLQEILSNINSALTEDIVLIATDTKLIVNKQ